MIWKRYSYLFYRVYKWYLKRFGEIDAPEYSALVIVSASIFFNIMTILIWLEQLSIKLNISSSSIDPMFFLFGFGILFINYLLFVRGKRYLLLVEYFEKIKEEPKENKRKGYKIGFYVIGSPIMYFISMAIAL